MQSDLQANLTSQTLAHDAPYIALTGSANINLLCSEIIFVSVDCIVCFIKAI